MRYMSVCMYVCRYVYKKYVCQNVLSELRGPNTHILKGSFGQLKLICDIRILLYARAVLTWMKKKSKKCSLRNEKLTV